MSNRFNQAVHHLQKRLGKQVPVSIVYHRGNDSIVLETGCWVGRTGFRTSDQLNGSRLEWSDRDYFIPVSLLVLNSVTVVPSENDWIEETFPVPDGVREYEILAPNDEPAWRYSDPERMIYRIHTKAKKTT